MNLDPIQAPEGFEAGVMLRASLAGLPSVSAPDLFEQNVLDAAKHQAASSTESATPKPVAHTGMRTARTVGLSLFGALVVGTTTWLTGVWSPQSAWNTIAGTPEAPATPPQIELKLQVPPAQPQVAAEPAKTEVPAKKVRKGDKPLKVTAGEPRH